MVCDLCSKKGPTSKTRIEGVVYDACSECAKLGEHVSTPKPARKRTPRRDPDEDVVLRNDLASRLRKARGSRSHEEFARTLSVKESDLHAWETGHRTPTIATARRLQKRVGVSLLTQDRISGDSSSYSSPSDSGSLTIGDMLKKR